jgi:hypothetical protein
MKSVEGFLYEFFHMDHGFSNTDVCFLSHAKPDSSLEQLLLGSRFPKRVEYLQGTPRSERDLARAAASSAKAIFVLADKKTQSVLEEDANNIMLVLSLRQYLLRCGASGKLNMFVEVLDSKSKTHLDQSLNAGLEPVVYLARNQQARFSLSCNGETATHTAAFEALSRQEAQLNSLKDMQAGKRIICIHEMKMSLLGVNAWSPGLSTLLCNLIMTTDNAPLEGVGLLPWQQEYWYGMTHEIYRCPFSPFFNGKTFREAASIVFQATSSVLFALQVSDGQGGRKILMGPMNHVIDDVTTTLGFVIAKDLRISFTIASYGLDAHTGRLDRNVNSWKHPFQFFSPSMTPIQLSPGNSRHPVLPHPLAHTGPPIDNVTTWRSPTLAALGRDPFDIISPKSEQKSDQKCQHVRGTLSGLRSPLSAGSPLTPGGGDSQTPESDPKPSHPDDQQLQRYSNYSQQRAGKETYTQSHETRSPGGSKNSSPLDRLDNRSSFCHSVDSFVQDVIQTPDLNLSMEFQASGPLILSGKV